MPLLWNHMVIPADFFGVKQVFYPFLKTLVLTPTIFLAATGALALYIIIVLLIYSTCDGGDPDPKDPKEREKARRRAKIESDRRKVDDIIRSMEAAREKAERVQKGSSGKGPKS